MPIRVGTKVSNHPSVSMQLLAETNLTASQRDLVNTIRCSGETLLILITDILDFSRIEANKMVLSLHHFKLRSVVEAAMEIAGLSAAQKRLQVNIQRQSESANFQSDFNSVYLFAKI